MDGIRGISAVWVLLHHTFKEAAPEIGEFESPFAWMFGWIYQGHFAVTVFIVLAGYSLMLSYANYSGSMRDGFWGYIRRRAWRIVPPYWAALVLAILLAVFLTGEPVGVAWGTNTPTDPLSWIISALLLQDLIPVTNVSFPFWSVAVEWHIYLLLPVILGIRRRASWFTAIGVGASIGLVGVFVGMVLTDKVERLYPEYYFLFALAAGACVIVTEDPPWAKRVPWTMISVLAIGTSISLLTATTSEWANDHQQELDVLIGLGVIAFIISLAQDNLAARVLTWRPFTVLGSFAYSIYLVHAPVLRAIWMHLVEPINISPALQLVIALAVVAPTLVLLSWGFHLVAERPFIVRSGARKRRAALAR